MLGTMKWSTLSEILIHIQVSTLGDIIRAYIDTSGDSDVILIGET
jgi:hypothetical protein